MLNFNDKRLNNLVASFMHYMVDPKHDGGNQIIETDYKNFFHYIDSRTWNGKGFLDKFYVE